MTEVAFHVNASDKIAHACRLLRKAHASGARVVVTGEGELLRRLDVELWTFSPLDFIPHGHVDSTAAEVLADSPIVLAPVPAAAAHRQVLVNLGPRVPEGFERFERLIEVLSQEEDDLALGRQRWRHYAERGYALKKHDLAGREAS